MEKNKRGPSLAKIDVLINGKKLTEDQKQELSYQIFEGYNFLKEKKKKIILKGYLFDAIFFKIRKIFGKPQTKRWERINDELNQLINKEIAASAGICEKIKQVIIIDKQNDLVMKFDDRIRSILYDTIGLYYSVVLDNQYGIYTEKIKGKVVIDAGSNIGEFALYAARLGAKKVYAFEPVTKTADILKEQIMINKLQNKVVLVKKALGDKNETATINFAQAGDGGASIIDGKGGTHYEKITIQKLDDFVPKREKVGFIKMDVEGYEENVLRGASKIISRDKPILSFSAYHKPTDKQILPALVRKIRPDYKIKLVKKAEEDFYCE